MLLMMWLVIFELLLATPCIVVTAFLWFSRVLLVGYVRVIAVKKSTGTPFLFISSEKKYCL
jgi:hypothetical protein